MENTVGRLFRRPLFVIYSFTPAGPVVYHLVELAMAATITLTAFGRKGILKTCSCFLSMSFLFAGSMFLLWKTAAPKNLIINNGVVYFQISPLLLIGTTVASYVLVRLFQRITGRAVPEELFCMVQVVHRGKRAVFRAKVDTGNQLREPFSHLPVIVVKETAVSHWRRNPVKSLILE